jgi:hypothetical protein
MPECESRYRGTSDRAKSLRRIQGNLGGVRFAAQRFDIEIVGCLNERSRYFERSCLTTKLPVFRKHVPNRKDGARRRRLPTD